MTDKIMTQAGEPAGPLLLCDASPPRHILVVDDDRDLRQINAMVLHHAGYHVDTAEDGAFAWRALGASHYDLIITDNHMPNLTGMQLLKKLYASRRTLPFIMASEKIPEEEIAQYPWPQPAATLLKPYAVEELLGAVKKVLREANGVAAGSQVFRGHDLKDNKISRAGEPAGATQQSLPDPSKHILVVDDDCDTRQLSVDVLAGSGYDAEGVKDGAAGWDALQKKDYDLIITDNKMPRMTGVEMIGKLRSANMSVPVIMATRYLPTHEFTRRPWLTPDAALERPFSNDELLATVKKVLGTVGGRGWVKETPRPILH